MTEISDFKVAVETMWLYLPHKLKELDSASEHLYIKREDLGSYLRFNSTWKATERARWHFSLGASYSRYLKITNEKRGVFKGEEFHDLVDPIAMVGFDYIIHKNLIFVSNISYGETWAFFENRPRKEQMVYGFSWAPFQNSPKTVWNNLSIDLSAFYTRFRDADEEFLVAIPVFPILNWQWSD